MSDELNTWRQRKNESAKAYEAAKLYFELGAERGIEEVARRLHKSRTIIARWSSRHAWVERARDYDAHIAVIQQIAIDKVRETEARKWAERESQIKEDGWELFLACKKKAQEMLLFPVSRKQIAQDGKQTVIEPAEWNFNTARLMADTAVKIGRLTVDLSTENLDIDFSRLTDKQLAAAKRALLAGTSIAEAISNADRD